MRGQRQPIELVVANMRNSGLTANYVADKLYAFQKAVGMGESGNGAHKAGQRLYVES